MVATKMTMMMMMMLVIVSVLVAVGVLMMRMMMVAGAVLVSVVATEAVAEVGRSIVSNHLKSKLGHLRLILLLRAGLEPHTIALPTSRARRTGPPPVRVGVARLPAAAAVAVAEGASQL